MMKKTAIFLCLLLAAHVGLNAQSGTYDAIMADLRLSDGVHTMYPEGQAVPTPAPRGYKPFYISHLGRHGARFALGSTAYGDQWAVWSSAHEKGILTQEGEEIFQAYAQLYPLVKNREGNLTQKGQEQHRRIAREMYRNYPAVFKGDTKARAVSTGVHRVIVSMYSFLGQLAELDKDFSYWADYGYPYQDYLLPKVIDMPNSWPRDVVDKFNAFADGRIHLSATLQRWFTDLSVIADPYRFLEQLHVVYGTLDNLDVPVPEKLKHIFTPDELYNLWLVNNYDEYLRLGLSSEVENIRPASMTALLTDIALKADEAVAGGPVRLDLRFAHDSTLAPVLSRLDVNGMGYRTADPLALQEHWRTFDIPMACNLQLIFFRSRKSPDILVQVLLNGREATLPLEMAAPGSFYRWTDVSGLLRR